MKRTMILLLALTTLLSAAACKPKANENITFTATVVSLEEDGVLVNTTDDVGFTDILLHMNEGYTPDFLLIVGQTVRVTILPMVTRSLPPQGTATLFELLSDAPATDEPSPEEGLDPMPMLTAGPVEASPAPEAETTAQP